MSMGATLPTPEPKTLKDRQLTQKLQELRQTDNVTNWYYVLRPWLVIAIMIVAAVWFHRWQIASGVSFWWNVPVFAVAMLAIGASQHQLAGASHEATHHTLFRNRLLNELASDWLCMFPLFNSTYVFRLHHLAHHNFINDPYRDPDQSQLRMSGHWLRFPVSKGRFLWKLAKQIMILPLLLYVYVRAKYNALGVNNNPYFDPCRTPSRWPARLAILFFAVSMAGHLILHRFLTLGEQLLLVSVAWPALILILLGCIPSDRYFVMRVRPVISAKTTMISRVIFTTILFAGLTTIARTTGVWAWRYFFILWVGSIFTTFAFFMILRQLVQHGNGDRGRLTNTRVFFVNPFIRYAVFPFGMDYHLPHHVYASIPHYRLKELHEYLLAYPEYHEKGVIVEGYFVPKTHNEERNPTVLEVLGEKYRPAGEDVFIDESVVEGMLDDVTDRSGEQGV